MTPLLGSTAIWALTQGRVVVWILILTRLTGLLAAMPGLGQERVPLFIRAMLAFFLSTVIAPVVPVPALLPTGMWEMTGMMVVELAAGLLMGTLVAWILEAVAFGGQLMDTQMGFSFAQFLDPVSARTVSISGSLLLQLAVLFILVSGLHHLMIRALVESFRILPMGAALPQHPRELVILAGQLFYRGLQLSFPVVLALFCIDVLEGVSARFMPQLQIMQISFPIKIAIGLLVLGVLLRELGPWLQPLLEAAPRDALRLLGS